MKKALLATAMLLSVAAVPAQAMTVAEFLSKAKALQSRGILAIGSPDIQLLKDEMTGIANAYRSDLESAKKAGRKPHSCPPPKGQTKMGAKELFAELESIPPARRNMSMKTAFYAIMQKRYPCS